MYVTSMHSGVLMEVYLVTTHQANKTQLDYRPLNCRQRRTWTETVHGVGLVGSGCIYTVSKTYPIYFPCVSVSQTVLVNSFLQQYSLVLSRPALLR